MVYRPLRLITEISSSATASFLYSLKGTEDDAKGKRSFDGLILMS